MAHTYHAGATPLVHLSPLVCGPAAENCEQVIVDFFPCFVTLQARQFFVLRQSLIHTCYSSERVSECAQQHEEAEEEEEEEDYKAR